MVSERSLCPEEHKKFNNLAVLPLDFDIYGIPREWLKLGVEMSEVDVLGLIWENKVSKRDLKQMSPLGLLLQTLLGKPVVGFVSHTPIPRPCAKLDTEEVLGEASLGDILFQELGIDTPNDSVILFEPESFAAAQEYSSSKLGRLLGDVLVELSGINLESTILQQPEYGLPARVKSPDTIEYF